MFVDWKIVKICMWKCIDSDFSGNFSIFCTEICCYPHFLDKTWLISCNICKKNVKE